MSTFHENVSFFGNISLFFAKKENMALRKCKNEKFRFNTNSEAGIFIVPL